MAHFHPQRVFPGYAAGFDWASRIPNGLALTSRVLAPLAFDGAPSGSENARPSDLSAARVVVCGFPRTGTTFMQQALAAVLGSSSRCWKNHDVLALPGYLEYGLPVLVPLRRPQATVVSWAIYHGDAPSAEALLRRLHAYLAWHREFRRHADDPGVRVIDFQRFSIDPAGVLERVLPEDDRADVLADVTVEDIAAAVHTSNLAARLDVSHRHTPSSQRDALKADYRSVLDNRRLRGILGRATDLYEDLASRIGADSSAALQQIAHEPHRVQF
jgi:hypothetical protein